MMANGSWLVASSTAAALAHVGAGGQRIGDEPAVAFAESGQGFSGGNHGLSRFGLRLRPKLECAMLRPHGRPCSQRRQSIRRIGYSIRFTPSLPGPSIQAMRESAPWRR